MVGKHQTRSFYLMYLRFPFSSSGIIHCDASGSSPNCIEAASGLFHPNGITKGPESSIYAANTATGEVKQFHMQADHTLIDGDTVATIPSPIDNIAVDEKGAIIIAAIPSMLKFVHRQEHSEGLVPSSVWRVRNETSEQK